MDFVIDQNNNKKKHTGHCSEDRDTWITFLNKHNTKCVNILLVLLKNKIHLFYLIVNYYC